MLRTYGDRFTRPYYRWTRFLYFFSRRKLVVKESYRRIQSDSSVRNPGQNEPFHCGTVFLVSARVYSLLRRLVQSFCGGTINIQKYTKKRGKKLNCRYCNQEVQQLKENQYYCSECDLQFSKEELVLKQSDLLKKD